MSNSNKYFFSIFIVGQQDIRKQCIHAQYYCFEVILNGLKRKSIKTIWGLERFLQYKNNFIVLFVIDGQKKS